MRELVTHRFPLERGGPGAARWRRTRAPGVLKVVLDDAREAPADVIAR